MRGAITLGGPFFHDGRLAGQARLERSGAQHQHRGDVDVSGSGQIACGRIVPLTPGAALIETRLGSPCAALKVTVEP